MRTELRSYWREFRIIEGGFVLHLFGMNVDLSFFFNDTATTVIYTLSLHDALPICLSLSKHLAHNLGNLLLLGKIGVFHNRRNASSRLLLLISKHLILCIYLVFRILA